MAVLMAAAALSFFPMMEDSGSSKNSNTTAALVAVFLYCKTLHDLLHVRLLMNVQCILRFIRLV